MRHQTGLFFGLAVAVVSAGCLGRPIQPTPVPVRTLQPTPTAAPIRRTASGLPSIQVTAKDSAYDMPDQIPAGWVSFTMQNEASSQRNAQLFRLNDGVTFDQAAAAFSTGQAPQNLVTFAGGLGTVPPGGTQTVVEQLTPGQYVMVSLIHDWFLVFHVPPGLVKVFRVVAPPGPQAADALPATQEDGVVHMLDFRYTLPEITPGEHTYRLVNEGQQPHEILIRRINPGNTLADVQAYIRDPGGQPPPYDEQGSGGALVDEPGSTEWMSLDLPVGDYVGICFVTEPSTGKSHAELGMLTEFNVK